MKRRFVIATLLVVGTLVTSVCRKTTDTSGLEELPKDIAANLQRVNADLFVSVPAPPAATKAPAKAPTPKSPTAAAPGTKSIAPPCRSTQRYFIQVTYPVTVCSSRSDLFSALSAYDGVMNPAAKPPTESKDVKNYKLSSFQGKTLTNSIFCQVRSGPWLATIVKQLNCQAQGSCQMTIAIPSSPLFLWNGQSCESQNRPEEVHYIEPLVDAGITRTPCNTKNTCQ